jgi:hypothetical protein
MSEELTTVRDTIEELLGDEEITPDTQVSTEDNTSEENQSAVVDDEDDKIETSPNEEPEPVADLDQSIEPPNSWRTDKRELFNSLPPEIKGNPQLQELLGYAFERESEQNDYILQRGQRYSELDKVLEPLENEWQRKGISPAKAVTQLLAWDKYIAERPLDAIQELAQRNGIDLAQFAQMQQAMGPQDPNLAYALNELQQLKAEREQEAVFREQQFQQGLNDEIERFRSSTKDGRALYPYFDNVREDMGHLIPLITKSNPGAQTQDILREAYDRAVHANPATRSAFQKQIEAQRALETQKKLAAKKTAGSSVAGSPEGGKVDRKRMTTHEIAALAYDGRL